MTHKIFIISGVSGAGKGTIINGVLKTGKFNLARGINVTTRPKEKRDEDEPHFQYVDIPKFKEMIKRDELLEYDFHHQNYYGTNRIILERLSKKHNILMEADVNGALTIKKKMSRCPANGGDAGSSDGVSILSTHRESSDRTEASGAEAVLIYIIVDLEILKKRVKGRGDETESEIEIRMKRAEIENYKGQSFDYQIENPEGHPEVAMKRVGQIIRKELNNK